MRKIGWVFLAVLSCLAPLAAPAAEPVPLRLGLVKFGSGAWEIDTIRHAGLDRTADIALDTIELANPGAGEVALQAGGVDAIITDWLWVARQRRAGQHIAFIPQSSALGEIMVPAGSPIQGLADLEGKRLGIAGGPLDKSWLMLRAYAHQTLGHELADRLTPVYGAPPLLSQELAAGRIDAVLTFWPYAARLSVQGAHSLISMTEVMRGLGFAQPVAMMGYGVSEDWIAAHPGALDRFLSATAVAGRILAGSDAEWQRLRPLTAAEDDATLAALRDHFRAGQMTGRPEDPAEAGRLFAILAATGGPDVTAGAAALPAGTFWAGLLR